MPGCCVEGCKNRRENGFRLFRIPTGKNNGRREEWLKLIGKNYTLSARTDICEVHFDEGQFEQARQDGKKLLRPNAIPNLLKKRKAEKEKKEERDMAKKAIYSNHIQDLQSHDYTETSNVEATNTEATNTEATNTEATNTEATNTEATNTNKQCGHIKRHCIKYN